MSRRDRLVVGGCVLLLGVQAVVPLAILWLGEGSEAAGDVALVAVSSPALVGVAGFAVALAAALATPGLEPMGRSGAVERGEPAAAVDLGPRGEARQTGPLLPVSRFRTTLLRTRWALTAALAHVASLAAAYVLDNGARAGSRAFAESLDDGSAMWGFAALVIKGLVLDLRGLVAFGVALVVLALARRPVRGAAPGRPVSRTTPWSRDRRPG